jgi:hypothetical protein
MKTKKIAFDVDFIGDQTTLTIEEEKALNDYFKQKKASLKVAEIRKPIKKSKTVTK